MWVHHTKVRWSDIDKLGHANNQAYWRWCEDVRNEQAMAIGLGEPDVERPSQIIAAVEARYLLPLSLHDEISVTRRVTRIGRCSHDAIYCVFKDETLIFEAKCTIVLFDFRASRAVPYPDAIKMRFHETC